MTRHADDKLDRRGQRQVNETIGLRVPRKVIEHTCARYMQGGKPAQRTVMLDDTDYSIVGKYQSEYRGIVQYYLMARNVGLFSKLRWVAETSLLKTLAGKHKSSVAATVRKYKAITQTQSGPQKCLRVASSERGTRSRSLLNVEASRSSGSEKPAWMKQMVARRRKTLVVCRRCHDDIHAGRSTAPCAEIRNWRAS